MTPTLQQLLTGLNVGMDGHPELVLKSGEDQLLVAGDQGSTLTASRLNDVLVGGAGGAANDASYEQVERRAA